MVRFSGRIAPNRRIRLRTTKQIQPFDRQEFRSDGDCRQRVVARIISKLPDVPLQPSSISEMAESFTKVILDAVEAEVPPLRCLTHKLGWCETAENSAAFIIAWNARGKMHDDSCALILETEPRGRRWGRRVRICGGWRRITCLLFTLK